jgi:MFS family permease
LVPPEQAQTEAVAFRTMIPERLDRLPWSHFHWFLVFALGITWILDGLEVTIKGAISGVLQEPQVLNLSAPEIGLIASGYLTGAVLGSLFFGVLTDRFGRQKLFFITLSVYLGGVLLTAFSWNLWSFMLFRFITGAGIGGEYSSVNSAIDELIPAEFRGRVDLIVNGSYWIGAAVGAASTIVLLDPKLFAPNVGWRLAFGAGAFLGLFILLLRKYIPESPRWLVTHGQREEGERIVREIEERIERETGRKLTPLSGDFLTIHPHKHFGLGLIARTMFQKYRKRFVLGLTLMISQAFLYNAIFFTYALVLTRFYDVEPGRTGIYLLPFALGNFAGPLILGRFFDTVGRRPMVTGTYAISALLLILTGILFDRQELSATSQTMMWSTIFFFASAAASSAYLTVSELFPLEMRALAIAFFYSLGTAVGGIAAPWVFGVLIGSGSRDEVFYGYVFAAILMLAAAGAEVLFGVKAEGVELEKLAAPLSSDE